MNAADRDTGHWIPKSNYGFGAEANRVQFWHAERIGPQGRETYKDERGVSCFDYPDLIAALSKAAESATAPACEHGCNGCEACTDYDSNDCNDAVRGLASKPSGPTHRGDGR